MIFLFHQDFFYLSLCEYSRKKGRRENIVWRKVACVKLNRVQCNVSITATLCTV